MCVCVEKCQDKANENGPTDSDHQLTEVKSKRKMLQNLKFGKMDVKKIRVTAWILLLGDAIHNFAGIQIFFILSMIDQ